MNVAFFGFTFLIAAFFPIGGEVAQLLLRSIFGGALKGTPPIFLHLLLLVLTYLPAALVTSWFPHIQTTVACSIRRTRGWLLHRWHCADGRVPGRPSPRIYSRRGRREFRRYAIWTVHALACTGTPSHRRGQTLASGHSL